MRRSSGAFGTVAFVSGAVFAIGLGLSGMTQPAKVVGFLDVAGDWDPSLAFVMMGAIGVHIASALRAQRGGAPVLADRFDLPAKRALDPKLLAGAALFGAGWGISGFCPGPAVVSLVALNTTTLAFVGAMLAGMALYTWVFARPAPGAKEPAGAARTAGAP